MNGRKSKGVREDALTAATAQFAERGFHGVSLAQIAASLGVSKQAVLHHYASKEKLYAEVLASIAKDYEALVAQARDSARDPQQQFEKLFELLLQASQQSHPHSKLLMRELLDVGSRAENPGKWYLKPFLDELQSMGSALSAWTEKSDSEVFAAIYQLIGAISYFAISQETIAGMYGPRQKAQINRAFTEEFLGSVRTLTAASE